MADKVLASVGLAALTVCALAACGQTGPLYLPEAPSDVVTRPATTPPPAESAEAPNSPQSPDSPPASGTPAPEVTAPESESKKDKGAAPPPPPTNR